MQELYCFVNAIELRLEPHNPSLLMLIDKHCCKLNGTRGI